MTLGRTMVSELITVYRMVRATIKQWLALPNDTPT